MSIAAATIRINTNFKPVLKLKRAQANIVSDIRISSSEDQAPSAIDSLSHAIRLYSTLRELWKQGSRAESGVCYVKINGDFVQVSMVRPKN